MNYDNLLLGPGHGYKMWTAEGKGKRGFGAPITQKRGFGQHVIYSIINLKSSSVVQKGEMSELRSEY